MEDLGVIRYSLTEKDKYGNKDLEIYQSNTKSSVVLDSIQIMALPRIYKDMLSGRKNYLEDIEY